MGHASARHPVLASASRLPRLTGLLLLTIVFLTFLFLHHSSIPDIASLPRLQFAPASSSSSSSASASADDPALFPLDPDNLLAYRHHLERTTSLASQTTHSPTLSFTSIYVLSLPGRKDRREQMLKLGRSLGLELKFVDAFLKDEPFIKWIAERVVEVRKQRVKALAKARKIKPSSIGGLETGTIWVAQTLDEAGNKPFPKLKDPRYKNNWVEHLEYHFRRGTLDQLQPANPNLNISEVLWDPIEPIEGRQVNDGVISTFFGHTRAMLKMIEEGDESALILEDDVDFEWDLERLWARIESKMPRDWELSFLGHCWGRELMQPAYLHPLLHASTAPLCLHAYALTQSGAQHLMKLLNNPWTAYQTAVDTAVPSYIGFNLVKSYSVEPPLVIQRKDGPSDIQAGIGSKWRGLLMDSAWERIEKDEGIEVFEPEWNPNDLDPATIFRYGRRKCDPVTGF
ncbi:hypothetical protein MNV49_006544 [Pseudohyphozyma bogoriensis]|nr:hypothetical protein MNV49_006544 [Pseudohyphozyma bogoriensis]